MFSLLWKWTEISQGFNSESLNPWETPEQQITHPLTQCRNQSSAQRPISCLTSISLVNSLFSQILKRKRKISIKTHCWKGFKCRIQIQSFRHKLEIYSICLKWTQEHLSIKIKPGNFVPLGVVLHTWRGREGLQKPEWNPTYPNCLSGNITTQINNVGRKKSQKKTPTTCGEVQINKFCTRCRELSKKSFVLLTVQADQDSVSLQLCHMNGIQLLIAWGKKTDYFIFYIRSRGSASPQALFTLLLLVWFFFFLLLWFLKALSSQNILGEAQTSLLKAGI